MERIRVNSGDIYHRWTVVAESASVRVSGKPKRMVRVACKCGSESIVPLSALRSGSSKSCGCLKSELASLKMSGQFTTHGMSRHPAYQAWKNMRRRCEPTFKQSKRYYHRGIRVCDQWSDPVVFLQWAIGAGYAEGLELDRRDNDKGYSPDNCRWVTRAENQRNRRETYWWYTDTGRFESCKQAADSIGKSLQCVVRRCESKNFPEYRRVRKYCA